jgi:hypothetical protein
MKVYILRFDTRPALTRAFDTLLASPDVGSCMIEAASHRIRFMAPDKPAEKLVEQIYRGGGLIWCSRHPVVAPPARAEYAVVGDPATTASA